MRDTGLPYTFTTPGGTLTLNPTNYEPPGLFIKDIDFRAPLRVEDSDRPQAHGSYLDDSWRSGMTGILEVIVVPTSAANRESLTNDLLEALGSLTGQEGTGTLAWTPQDGSAQRQLSGLQILDDPQQIRMGGTLKGYQVPLKAEKPYAESATATEVDTTALTAGGSGFTIPLVIPVQLKASGGGTATVTNSGSSDVMPLMRIYGPITDPVVWNNTTGYRLAFVGSIASGDYWEIDLFQKTVTLNGNVTVRALDVAASTWFALGRGDTALQLSGSQFTASTLLRTYMRSAWH